MVIEIINESDEIRYKNRELTDVILEMKIGNKYLVETVRLYNGLPNHGGWDYSNRSIFESKAEADFEYSKRVNGERNLPNAYHTVPIDAI